MTEPSHAWLRVQPECMSSDSEFKSAVKRSLFAASFHFNVRTVDGLVCVEGAAEAKLPFKEPWRYRASTIQARTPTSKYAEFSFFSEIDEKTDRRREWTNQGNRLIYRETLAGVLRSESVVSIQEDAMTVTSPLLLLPGLCSSFSPSIRSFGAVFVAGSKFAALKLERVLEGPSELDGSFELAGVFQSLNGPISSEEWFGLNWRERPHFTLHWNSELKLVTRISADAPVLGRIDFTF